MALANIHNTSTQGLKQINAKSLCIKLILNVKMTYSNTFVISTPQYICFMSVPVISTFTSDRGPLSNLEILRLTHFDRLQ